MARSYRAIALRRCFWPRAGNVFDDLGVTPLDIANAEHGQVKATAVLTTEGVAEAIMRAVPAWGLIANEPWGEPRDEVSRQEMPSVFARGGSGAG